MCHEKYSVGAGSAGFIITLGEAAEFFAERSGPDVAGSRIVGEALIFVDGFSSYWVDNGICKMLEMWHWGELRPFWEKVVVAWDGASGKYKCLESIVRNTWCSVWTRLGQ
jgi:hypothetical protein